MGDDLLVVAGEASADGYAAAVLAQLERRWPGVRPFGIAGPALRRQRFDVLAHAEELSLIGLTEVLSALPRVAGIFRRVVRECGRRRPRVALLLDLPDFNLRLATRLRRLGVQVVYYISPQVWAWRTGRVETIRACVDRMLVALPFEERFYREHGIAAEFVGHPLLEGEAAVAAEPDRVARAELGLEGAEPVVALLPGSRGRELRRHLEPMLASARLLRRHLPRAGFVLPVAPTLDPEPVTAAVARAGVEVAVLRGQADLALRVCDVAAVCSGTATLQTALALRPMVVVYRVSALTAAMVRRFAHVDRVALVNLISPRKPVLELLQDDFTPEKLAQACWALLRPSARAAMLAELREVRETLGSRRPSERVAEVVFELSARS